MATAITLMPQDTASGQDLESGEIEMVSSGERGGEIEPNSPPVDPSQPQEPSSPPVDPSQPQRRQLVPIPRVHGLLRRASRDLFTPQNVVIGPYHVKRGSYLFLSSGVKDKAVQHIIKTRTVDREDLKAVLRDLENEVRSCYTHLPEDSMNNSEEFSTMLLLDGCYLLCRFIKFEEQTETSSSGGAGSTSSSGGGDGSSSGGGASGLNGGGANGDSSSNGGGDGGGSNSGHGSGSSSRGGDVGGDIAADQMILDKEKTSVRDILYLLENQVPFCVLEAILSCIYEAEKMQSALQVIYRGVQELLHKRFYISKKRQLVPSMSTSTPSDLLHLVYSYFRRGPEYVAPGLEQGRDLAGMGRWRRATDYHKYANIQFRPRKLEEFQNGQQGTILDIDIQGGTLYIPPLQVHTDTMTLLRNLMVLEEKEEEQRPVTAYCLFMSQVACTAEDVQLLQHAGILNNFMPSDEEAAREFAYLCTGLAMEINSSKRNYLRSVWHDLEKRCSELGHNFIGFFREKYCSTVFYRLVFVVAILTFVSTVTQAICSVIGLLPTNQTQKLADGA